MKKHLFLIIALILLIVLVCALLYILNNKEKSVVSTNEPSTISAEVIAVPEIPIEDEVIDPPPIPTE